MKSKITNEKVLKLNFPCLMSTESGKVVLVYGNSSSLNLYKGVLLADDQNNTSYIGEYSNCWAATLFKPFEGEIKLSN